MNQVFVLDGGPEVSYRWISSRIEGEDVRVLTVLCRRLRLLDVFVKFEIILRVFDSKSLKESVLDRKTTSSTLSSSS